MTGGFVIVIFRELISAILNFFFRFFKKTKFPIEQKHYENRSMGFRVTLLLKLSIILKCKSFFIPWDLSQFPKKMFTPL